MGRDGEVKQMQHFYHHGDTICHPNNVRVHLWLITSFNKRFNKIAIQGVPQMAVDKEAISLSRVYSYYP